jgi:leucyl-tRNA synthetase
VAPALASECWETLHTNLLNPKSSQPDSQESTSSTPYPVPSIFASPWPEALLSDVQVNALSTRGAKTVAVQINGKLRFTVTIPRQPLPPRPQTPTSKEEQEENDDEKDFVLSRVLETEAGRLWLREKNDWEKRKKVVVVRGGMVVSVVF